MKKICIFTLFISLITKDIILKKKPKYLGSVFVNYLSMSFHHDFFYIGGLIFFSLILLNFKLN